MAWWLGNPCICGYSYEEVSETHRKCHACNREWFAKPLTDESTYWEQVTHRSEIEHPIFCNHNRPLKFPCHQCPSQEEREKRFF